MARSSRSSGENGDADMSIVGPGMKVVGDLVTEGTVRIEGRVEGNVEAGKAVVVGKEGQIHGDIRTEDSIISGRVQGSVTAASRLEVQSSARIDGEIHARRLQLEEGAMVNGTVRMGEIDLDGGEDTRAPTPESSGGAAEEAESGTG